MKRLLFVVLGLVMMGAVAFYAIKHNTTPAAEQNATQQDSSPVAEGFDKNQYSIDEPGSLWWIVNKQRPLPDEYIPASQDAPNILLRWARSAESMQLDIRLIEPLESMVADAENAGHEIMLVSGYRSQAYQTELYNNYVEAYGEEEASRFSAKPGTSEHQTGLVADLGMKDGTCEIEECFGETAAGKWLAVNGHKYGFIVRYLQGKEAETGYLYEPWHFRYVGVELARELYDQNTTMEEFFGVDG
jgi:D-alanyl-D-alanine carboxypeptidase